VEFIHFLFENYSKRGLTEPTDRRVAASGLEARIAGGLHCNNKYGIFEKHLHRNLLWQTSDEQTERIAYTNNQEVPSWSWMACSGGIEFMEVQMGLVSWVKALVFDTGRDSAALITDVGKFLDCTMKSEVDRCIVLDIFTNKEAGWIRHQERCRRLGESLCRSRKDREPPKDSEQPRRAAILCSGRCVNRERWRIQEGWSRNGRNRLCGEIGVQRANCVTDATFCYT
jgi:hypothetical protein